MDEDQARRILGVGREASIAQAREAYKRRAKAVHPDLNPELRGDRNAAAASEAGEPAAGRAMAELNEAWRTIRTALLARAAGWAPPVRPTPPPRPRRRTCAACGHVPAIPIDLRSLTGLVVLHRMDRYATTLCRSCGTALCRDVQAQTLTLGWWGLFAVFVNLAVVVNNLSYFRALADLPPPRERSDPDAPLAEPMGETAKVSARWSPWLGCVTAAGLVVLGLVLILRTAR